MTPHDHHNALRNGVHHPEARPAPVLQRRSPTRSLDRLVGSFELFTQHVAGTPLRPYQLEPAAAIIDSVRRRRGLTFTVMMSRQAGKNELSAQVEAYLLALSSRRGGSIVKAAPTFRPQIVNSMLRLQRVLDNDLTREYFDTELGYIVSVGKARAFFFSAGEDSNIVGATASILLEVDEAQDVSEEKYLKDLRPMGASTNVTTVLYGTAWTSDTLLEHVRQENARLEAVDGTRRNFRYPWHVVGQHNPFYRAYVEAEIARMGPEHPLVRTQYLLETLSGGGRMLSETQLAELRGAHGRLHAPLAGESYVAGVDIAGEDEEAEDAALRSLKPRKDSTTVTIARLTWSARSGVLEPRLEVVQLFRWTGRKHRELLPQLVDLLGAVWRCQAVVVDATGVGAGVASFLVGALGAQTVVPFAFTAVSKSDLGYQLLAAINGGGLKIFGSAPASTGGEEDPEAFFNEAPLARSGLHANQRLAWYVDPAEGHDDLLISTALAVQAAQVARPRTAFGRQARRE